MAHLVGSTPWLDFGTGTTAVPLPAGAVSGDLAVLVLAMVAPSSQASAAAPVPDPRWAVAGHAMESVDRMRTGLWVYTRLVDGAWQQADVEVSRRSSPPSWSSSSAGTMLLLRGTGGVGAVSSSGARGVAAALEGGMVGIGHAVSVFPEGEVLDFRDASAGLLTASQRRAHHLDGVSVPIYSTHTRAFLPAVVWDGVEAGFAGLEGTTGSRPVLLVEVLPPAAPYAPELVGPLTGTQVGVPSTTRFAWKHNPSSGGGGQTGYQWRAQVGASNFVYWDVLSGALSTVPVTNAGPAGFVDIPTSLFGGVGESLSWTVATQDERMALGEFASPASVMLVDAPTVTVTGPTGVVSDDLTPSVAWQSSTPEGVQTGWHVHVLDVDGRVVYDSGERSGSNVSFTVPVLEWANGGEYTFQVRIRQTGGAWSEWGETVAVVSWEPPATPSMEVFDFRPGVRVVVTDVPVSSQVVVRRAGTGEHVGVVDAPEGGTVELHDPFAPFDVPVEYEAQVTMVLDGEPFTSAWGRSHTVVSSDGFSYLAVDASPADAVRVAIVADGDRQDQTETLVSWGLGATRPMVDRGPVRGSAGSMTLICFDRDELASVLSMLRSGEVLRLRYPPDAGRALPVLRFHVSDAPTVGRRVQTSSVGWREVSFGWVEGGV